MAEFPLSSCNSAEPVTIVVFELDGCGLRFGEGACPGIGDRCYNTFNTCTSPCVFECSPQEFVFSTCELPKSLARQYTPNIISVTDNPTTLEIGKTFSTRQLTRIKFQDIPHNDAGFDPYFPRGVIPICPEDQPGTLMARWIRRVKYFEGRRVSVFRGTCDMDLCDMDRQILYIDKWSGPSSDCVYCLDLVDALSLATDIRAKCPTDQDPIAATSLGVDGFPEPLRLGIALEVPTDSNPDVDPLGSAGLPLMARNYLSGDPAQDALFARMKHICIDREIIEVEPFISTTPAAGWNLKLKNRARCGSEISSHDVNARIQPVETFENTHIVDVVRRLIEECAGLDTIAQACCTDDNASLIDCQSFDDFRCERPLDFITDTLICKPVGVTTLLNELSTQFLFNLYYDANNSRIRISGLRPGCPLDDDLPEFTECMMSKMSLTGSNQGDHYSRVVYYHSLIDWTDSIEQENTSNATAEANIDSGRMACDRRTWRTVRTKEFVSRWITDRNQYLARAYAKRWLRLRECDAETVRFETTLALAQCIELNGAAILNHPKLQDVDGSNDTATQWLLKGYSPQSGDCAVLTFERAALGEISPCFDCDAGDCSTPLVTEMDSCEIPDCVEVW